MAKQVLGIALLLIGLNFLFLANQSGHVTQGIIFLVLDAVLFWPEIIVRLKNL